MAIYLREVCVDPGENYWACIDDSYLYEFCKKKEDIFAQHPKTQLITLKGHEIIKRFQRSACATHTGGVLVWNFVVGSAKSKA